MIADQLPLLFTSYIYINLGKEYVSLKHFSCQVEVTNFAHVLVGIYLTFKTFILVDHIRRAACAAR